MHDNVSPAEPEDGDRIIASRADRAENDAADRPDRQESTEPDGVEPTRGAKRNESVEAAAELSERGGIRPENLDPAEHHDRTSDRELTE